MIITLNLIKLQRNLLEENDQQRKSLKDSRYHDGNQYTYDKEACIADISTYCRGQNINLTFQKSFISSNGKFPDNAGQVMKELM